MSSITNEASSDIVSADNLIPTTTNPNTVNNGIDDLKLDAKAPIESSNSAAISIEPEVKPFEGIDDLKSDEKASIESSNPAAISIEPEVKPFEGKYNLDRLVQRNNEHKTEYRYFGEIKITGEDSLIVKNKISIEFYFALQICNKKESNKLILEVRQADIFCNNWILLMCFREPDNSDKCSAIFIPVEWFELNRAQLNTTDLLDNILLANEGRAKNIMMIYDIDDLLQMSSDSANCSTDSFNILNKTGVLPKTIDYRLPLLKVLKGAIYSSNDIIDYAKPPVKPPTVPPILNAKTKARGPVGSREPGYTKQSNALKQLTLRNNHFGDASQNIIQASIEDPDSTRLKRNVKKPTNSYQSAIDEVDDLKKRKNKLAAKRKRKQENKENQTPQLGAINTKPEDSAAAKEILMLKKQLDDLKNSLKSSSVSPMIQAEAVVADDSDNNKLQYKKTAKRNKKSAVEEPRVVELGDNESFGKDKVNTPATNNEIDEVDESNSTLKTTHFKKQKGKGKQNKQNAVIISLLEKNNNELVEMKNRIHFLEGYKGGFQGNRSPLLLVDQNSTPSSQLSISTPLIDKHFPSQQNTNSTNDRRNNHGSDQQRNCNDGYGSSTPHPSTAVHPYYAQNPYFIQQQPPSNCWQGGVMQPPQGMFQQGNQHDVNRHFMDYAVLDFVSNLRRSNY